MGYRIWIYLWLSLYFAKAQAANIESINMDQAPGYTNLRDCAKYCFASNGRGNIFGDLSCSENQCLCRHDLLSSAHSAVSSCIYTQQCQETNTVDLSLGLSFYDSYCSSYHVAAGDGVVLATTTDGNSTPTTPAAVTVTVTSRPTSAASTPLGNQSSSSPSPTPPSTLITSSSHSSTSSSSSASSTTNSGSDNGGGGSGNGNAGSGGNGNGRGLSRSDILTIIFGVLGAVVAVSVAVWQGRRQSVTRRRWREWREGDL